MNAEETKLFFNQVGPWFYSFFFTLVGYRSSLKSFMRFNHPHLGLRKGMKILDAGIGTGFLSTNLLREAPEFINVAGLDYSDGMFVGLRKRLAKLALEDRAIMLFGDMCQMPFSDESFDLVMTSAAVEYLSCLEKAVYEFGRVLRPGGKLLIIFTKKSFFGKIIAVLWRSNMLDPLYISECMNRAGINRIDTLKFPRNYFHVNNWGAALLGEKTA